MPPEPTVLPTPTAAPAAASAPSPTPEPPSLDALPIARGEARPLPEGLALYYRFNTCYPCHQPVFDVRRIVIDGASGSPREDRPLASLDSVLASSARVVSFGVSPSGESLAAMVCHVGLCAYGLEFDRPDSVQRLWVSHDGGSTWRDAGRVLPQSGIARVTDDDVLIAEQNVWRERWRDITDAEWDRMLAELAPLGLDERTGWESRSRWLVSGEFVASTADGRTRPTLGRGSWVYGGTRSDGANVWFSNEIGHQLLLIEDGHGEVEQTYRLDESFWHDLPGGMEEVLRQHVVAGFFTDDLFWWPVRALRRVPRLVLYALSLVDLRTGTMHPVEGLILPLVVDSDGDGHQDAYYSFIAARPSPSRLDATEAGGDK